MDVALAQVGQVVGVAQAGHVVDGVVEVEVVVVVPVHETPQVVHAGEREAPPDEVGVLQEGIGGVIGAEGRPGGRDEDARRAAVLLDEGRHLEGDVGVVHRLHVAAVTGVGLLVVPALVVDGVDAEDLHPSGVDVAREGGDHPLPLVFVLVAPAGREREHRQAVVAVDADGHLPVQPRGAPACAPFGESVRARMMGRESPETPHSPDCEALPRSMP